MTHCFSTLLTSVRLQTYTNFCPIKYKNIVKQLFSFLKKICEVVGVKLFRIDHFMEKVIKYLNLLWYIVKIWNKSLSIDFLMGNRLVLSVLENFQNLVWNFSIKNKKSLYLKTCYFFKWSQTTWNVFTVDIKSFREVCFFVFKMFVFKFFVTSNSVAILNFYWFFTLFNSLYLSFQPNIVFFCKKNLK